MKPKGTLLIIGGAEFRGGDEAKEMSKKNNDFVDFDILKELIPPTNGRTKRRIEFITSASEKQDEMIKTYKSAFRKIGYTNVGFLNMVEKEEARAPEVCERINEAHAVFFTGGDQFRLSTILGGTECIKAIKDRFHTDKDFVVAGTSAGAMVMSKVMIYEGGTEEALLKEDLKTSSGLGLFDTCIIDTHFIKRGRFGRLAQAIVMNPEALGIGLGEDTVLIIKNGTEAECSGSGTVVIIDGNNIGQTNITEVEEGHPIYIENLRVHLLSKGCRFSIPERAMQAPKRAKQKTA
jgi:cyanophycinase